MRNSSAFSVTFFLACLIASSSFVSATENAAKPCQYLVYVNYPNGVNHEAFDDQIVSQVVGSMEEAKKVVIYHYNTVMSGFVATLTPAQAERIKQNPSVNQVMEVKGTIKTQSIIGKDLGDPSGDRTLKWFYRYVLGILYNTACFWPFC